MVNPMLFLMTALAYVTAFVLLGLYTGVEKSGRLVAFGSFQLPLEFSYRRLFILSVLGLFLEMLMIRWISSEIRIFAYYKNFVLIACFLGFGLGCALCRRRVYPLATALPILFFTIFVASPIPGMRDGVLNLTTLIGMTSQVQIWGVTMPEAFSYSALAVAIVAVAPLFASIVFSFVPIGQVVGSALENARRGAFGYTVNVAGSLVGILLYTVLCFLYQPPAIWFLVASALFAVVFFSQRKSLLVFSGACLLAAAALTLWVSDTSKTYWSPYQRLTLSPMRNGTEIVGYSLNTNDSWYQWILNLSPDYLAHHKSVFTGDPDWNPYNLPYRFVQSPQSVLILGSGMGNDVAAALRNTNAEVTAVEIDPLILKLGEALHFERPYQSNRVHIINDDARSYIQNSRGKFDLIVFAFLDSHTTASSFSNVRIDNFVYTVEAMAHSRDLLNPDGVMVVKFQLGAAWIGERLRGLIQQVFHRQPFEARTSLDHDQNGAYYVVGSESAMQHISQNSSLSRHMALAPQAHTTLSTDDWPYFYQRERGLPVAVLGLSGFLVWLSWYMVRRVLGSKPSGLSPSSSVHFVLLGAGFMLLEAQIISKMALLFGTTWVVNSIVISGLLVLIMGANLIFERWPSYSLTVPYVGIILAALLAYLIPLRALLFESLFLRFTVATLLLCLPVFFAGMVFIRSFADAHFSGVALGWNLIGAVLGGMLETISQATGLRALVLIAVGLYIGSWVARSRAGKTEVTEGPLNRSQDVTAEEWSVSAR
jgi:Spermine/spermidine synthase domain